MTEILKNKIDELEAVRSRLNKALTRLDGAINIKLEKAGSDKEKMEVQQQEKIARMNKEKASHFEELKKTNALLEEEIVKLNEKLHKERGSNERLKKFGADMNNKIETVIKQLELLGDE